MNAGLSHFHTDHDWPLPNVNKVDEPSFFFIVTPPYSGSTALAQVLNSCQGACFLQKKAEGQWLVPGMCRKPESWDPEADMNWNSIRAVWLDRVRLIRELVQEVEVVIEKSPPNLVRFDQLTKTFPNYKAIAYNRDPFANCASILYRRHNPGAKSKEERVKIVRGLASDWIFRSRWIKKWIDEMGLVHISYEKFCLNPELLITTISAMLPVFKSVDVKRNIKVKDYKAAQLSNHNKRQISNLSQEEVAAIGELLEAEKDLVEFFGYSAHTPSV